MTLRKWYQVKKRRQRKCVSVTEPCPRIKFWLTRLNRDFIFWSFICTMIDTQTQIRGLNKSNWLQNWEYSQIMLVWHLSLTQSQMLYLWKCDRPMSKSYILYTKTTHLPMQNTKKETINRGCIVLKYKIPGKIWELSH